MHTQNTTPQRAFRVMDMEEALVQPEVIDLFATLDALDKGSHFSVVYRHFQDKREGCMERVNRRLKDTNTRLALPELRDSFVITFGYSYSMVLDNHNNETPVNEARLVAAKSDKRLQAYLQRKQAIKSLLSDPPQSTTSVEVAPRFLRSSGVGAQNTRVLEQIDDALDEIALFDSAVSLEELAENEEVTERVPGRLSLRDIQEMLLNGVDIMEIWDKHIPRENFRGQLDTSFDNTQGA